MSNPFDDRSRYIKRPFETTCWSVVIRAGALESNEAKQQAIRHLCEQYWLPLYLFARKKVGNEHDAQDLTQAFFSQVIACDFFSKADADRGRFRTFLLTGIQNFINNDWKKQKAQKRGGDVKAFSIDFRAQPDDSVREQYFDRTQFTAQQIFERRWAIELLKSALQLLQADYEQQGRIAIFEELKPTISTLKQVSSYAEIGGRLGMTEANVKIAAHRLREHFRQKVRLLVADTVADHDEIDAEIRSLFDAFSN